MFKSSENGFTLLELLISITIVAVIIAIIFGAMRAGIRVWEKGEQNIESRQRQRIILNMLKRQLASVCLSNITYTREPFYLKGSEKRIEFVSSVSLLSATEGGYVHVVYSISPSEIDTETEICSLSETNFIDMNSGQVVGGSDKKDFTELISGFKEISFEYLNENENEEKEKFEWTDEWNIKDKKKFPKAIKINLKANEDDFSLSIIASVHSETES